MGFFWGLIFGPGIFLGLDFWLHLIIPVTWNLQPRSQGLSSNPLKSAVPPWASHCGHFEAEHCKRYHYLSIIYGSPLHPLLSLPPGKRPQNTPDGLPDIFAVKKSKQSAMRYTVKIFLKQENLSERMRAACKLLTTTPILSYSKIFQMIVSLLSEVHFVANYQERSIWHPWVFDVVERRTICNVKT